nr:PREDICTED: uncharacterized protein LOC109037050 [Bemisia tabaci]
MTNIKINKLIKDNKKLSEQVLSQENISNNLLPKIFNNETPINNFVNDSILKEKFNESTQEIGAKRNLLILSASHGRGLSNIFKDSLGSNISITSIFKPNAKIEQVIENLKDLTKNFNERDIVIIIGGSNNFHYHDKWNISLVASKIKDVIENVKKPQIFFQELFPRYDIPANVYHGYCKFASAMNNMLWRLTSETNNVNVLPNKMRNRSDFTTHGLHLNKRGKKYLVNSILTTIIKVHTRKNKVLEHKASTPERANLSLN